jgi:ArsR family transcriptional regulator
VGVSTYHNSGPAASEPGCQVNQVTDAEIKTASQSIRALASPARLRILCLLLEGERSVVEVTRLVRNHTQSSISQHLSFLLKSGIVSNRKYKTQMLYRVNDKRMGPLMELVEQVFCGFPAQRRDGRSVGEMMSSH